MWHMGLVNFMSRYGGHSGGPLRTLGFKALSGIATNMGKKKQKEILIVQYNVTAITRFEDMLLTLYKALLCLFAYDIIFLIN